MRLRLFFILPMLLISFLSSGQKTEYPELQKFNRFLGEERASVLEDAVDSFDRFLLKNFSEYSNNSEKTTAFLEQISSYNEPKESWILETDINQKIVDSFESTGLRKEIWIYGYENYESKHDFNKILPTKEPDTTEIKELGELHLDLIEQGTIPLLKVDPAEEAGQEKEREERRLNSFRSNYQGDYVYGLLEYASKDSFIYKYTQAGYYTGVDLSKGVIANAFLYSEVNYDNPLVSESS